MYKSLSVLEQSCNYDPAWARVKHGECSPPLQTAAIRSYAALATHASNNLSSSALDSSYARFDASFSVGLIIDATLGQLSTELLTKHHSCLFFSLSWVCEGSLKVHSSSVADVFMFLHKQAHRRAGHGVRLQRLACAWLHFN